MLYATTVTPCSFGAELDALSAIGLDAYLYATPPSNFANAQATQDARFWRPPTTDGNKAVRAWEANEQHVKDYSRWF